MCSPFPPRRGDDRPAKEEARRLLLRPGAFRFYPAELLEGREAAAEPRVVEVDVEEGADEVEAILGVVFFVAGGVLVGGVGVGGGEG